MDQQSKTQTTNSILNQTYAIEATKKEIATRKELIEEHVEGKHTWLDLETAKEELARVKIKYDQELSGDGDYNNMLEDLGQLKDKLKSEKETMSDLIVGYRIETGEHQIELNQSGDAQELVLKGTLGKKAKYQMSIFNESKSAE